jgi:hypothetical protein
MKSIVGIVSGASRVPSEEASESLLAPEILLPIQFANHDTNQGERRLMLAVLEEAVVTFQRNLHARTRRGQRLFREADEWSRSADTSWTFAFENVCHALGLDPEYLREGLQRLKERPPASEARGFRFRRVSGRRTSVVASRVVRKEL